MSGNFLDPNKIVYDDGGNGGNKSYLNPSFVPEIVLNKDGEKADVATIDNNNKSDNDLNENRQIDFDDLLPLIGEFGRYQKILFLLMIPFAFFVAFVYFAQIFITLVPEEHWCRIPELQDLPLDLR